MDYEIRIEWNRTWGKIAGIVTVNGKEYMALADDANELCTRAGELEAHYESVYNTLVTIDQSKNKAGKIVDAIRWGFNDIKWKADLPGGAKYNALIPISCK